MTLGEKSRTEIKEELGVALIVLERFIATVEKKDFSLYADLPYFPRDLDVYEVLSEARILLDFSEKDMRKLENESVSQETLRTLTDYNNWFKKINKGVRRSIKWPKPPQLLGRPLEYGGLT